MIWSVFIQWHLYTVHLSLQNFFKCFTTAGRVCVHQVGAYRSLLHATWLIETNLKWKSEPPPLLPTFELDWSDFRYKRVDSGAEIPGHPPQSQSAECGQGGCHWRGIPAVWTLFTLDLSQPSAGMTFYLYPPKPLLCPLTFSAETVEPPHDIWDVCITSPPVWCSLFRAEVQHTPSLAGQLNGTFNDQIMNCIYIALFKIQSFFIVSVCVITPYH